MPGQLVGLLLSLGTGAIGGNVTGALFKTLSLGRVGNSTVGMIGGGIGGQIVDAAVSPTGGSGLVSNIALSFAGSIVLTAIMGLLRNALSKK
jgi:hypothetical protein